MRNWKRPFKSSVKGSHAPRFSFYTWKVYSGTTPGFSDGGLVYSGQLRFFFILRLSWVCSNEELSIAIKPRRVLAHALFCCFPYFPLESLTNIFQREKWEWISELSNDLTSFAAKEKRIWQVIDFKVAPYSFDRVRTGFEMARWGKL